MSSVAHFEAKVTDVEEVNPLFSKCKVYVMYSGLNRNKSFISKEVIESALPTLYNIPIVGEFKEDKEDFGSHGGKIVIDDSGINYVKTTMPYGVVPESATFSWETVTEDGAEHEYLVIDGAFLWTGRYEEANKVIEDGRPQSMEVEFTKTTFDKKSKITNVQEMLFSALCILGEDVEPAFESAKIGDFSLADKEVMRAFVKEMVFELAQQGLLQVTKEGGNDVPKDAPVNAEFSLSSEQLEDELRRVLRAQEQATDEWGWTCSRYWYVDNKDTTVIARDNQNGGLVGFDFSQSGDLITVNFDSGKRFKIEYVEMDVNGGSDGDGSASNASGDGDFSLVTKEQMEFAVEMAKKSTEETVKAEFAKKTDDKKDKKDKPDTGNSKADDNNDENAPKDQDKEDGDFTLNKEEIEKMQSDFTELQGKFTALETEATELREFKVNAEAEARKAGEEAVFAKFSKQLTEEELSSVKEGASKFSLEQLETQLFALVGKKMANGEFSLNNKGEGNKVPLFDDAPSSMTKSNASYASLIEKYRNKK